jgi:[protein-PII] uridylyltransferase
MSQLRANVVAAKEQLAEAHRSLRARHEAGATALDICGALCAARDEVLIGLYHAALADLHDGPLGAAAEHVTLVAHGGYGRRDVAPYSDVDLMILHDYPHDDLIVPLAQRLLRDVCDAGLVIGHSVCTVPQACASALQDCLVCTSLVESRLLTGNAELFARFQTLFHRQITRRWAPLSAAIEKARSEERLRYGETVFLLEPNLKRSRGALRDVQLLRWIGFVRYGHRDLRELQAQGTISEADCQVVMRANEFLLQLRNELHFHAGKPGDVLDRSEQLRMAARYGYEAYRGLLPVEQFMRDYFRHTSQVNHLARKFVAKARAKEGVTRLVTAMLGHRVDNYRVGPAGIVATRLALARMRGNLAEIIRLVDLANHYDVPIAPGTWETVRQEAAMLPPEVSPEACEYFLSFLSCSSRLGELLRDLHEAAILERFIPAFAHARGLLQFNQYHKYTVDEHSLRAVEATTDFANDQGALGRAYRSLKQKQFLHLALLLHDLGKGYGEEHIKMGTRIAAEVATRLGLAPLEAETVRFLVANHQMMGQLAFRRDTTDPQLVLRFAVEVGSPERLKSLFVLTAADYSAVGPGVWDSWKTEILTDLYLRALEHLAGDNTAIAVEAQLEQSRLEVIAHLQHRGGETWFLRQLAALPESYLVGTIPKQIADDLLLLSELEPHGVIARGEYQSGTDTVLFTVATCEDIVPGIFHRLTGALTSHGLEIRTAQINTLADGLVIDRFWVYDPDYRGESPTSRLVDVERALVESLRTPSSSPPTFRRTWSPGRRAATLIRTQTRVNVDNTSSEAFTVFDIFAHDRSGLLYSITRKLFELGLSVGRAQIATHVDQVIDVFYVTDQAGQKILDKDQLAEIRQQLLQVCEREPAAQ